MSGPFTRHPKNPILTATRPQALPWRRVAVLCPAVVRDEAGTFWLIERASDCLAPYRSVFGLLSSPDGVTFTHVSDAPILSAADLGYPEGSLQDPRIVRMGNEYPMTAVIRAITLDCVPDGLGPPRYPYRGGEPIPEGVDASARSCILRSTDLRRWSWVGWTDERPMDDRDNALFPDKIAGRYWLLRRPRHLRCADWAVDGPGIWISTSEDLRAWSPPEPLAGPASWWELIKIGAGAPPVRLPEGWLLVYHGVDDRHTYRVGLMLLDGEDPRRVLARTAEPVLSPEADYERRGLIIPECVYPTAALRVGDELWVYYSCCDVCIALATAPIAALLDTMTPC